MTIDDDFDEMFERALLESEENCDKHVYGITIAYKCDANAKKHRRQTIAALLRVLAEYTDGYCAVRGALDEDLKRSPGITFRFSSVDKRRAFWVRVKRYLHPDVLGCLTGTIFGP